MSDTDPDQKSSLPSWLLGLIIAAALFVIGFFLFNALGFGDDPVIDQWIVVPVVFLRRRSARRDTDSLTE